MSLGFVSSFQATRRQAGPVANGLWSLERALLLIGITGIPLNMDKFLFFHEQDSDLGAVAGLNVSITTIALIALYGIWIADTSLRRRRMIFRPLFGIPMLAYLGIVFISAALADVPLLSLFDFALLFQAYLLFFFVANRVQTRSDVMLCIFALAVALVMQGMIMLAAAAIGMNDSEFAIGPLLIAVNEGGRHAGTMYSPVLAGSTLALIWLPVATSLMFVREKWFWRFLLLATATGLVAILLTQTRGALLTTIVGGLIIGCGLFSRGWLPSWTISLSLLLAVLSAYPLVILYQQRIQHGDDESAASRKHLSQIAIEVISERPILGHGAGNSHLAGMAIGNQADYRGKWYYTVHSKYLVVWIETGIIGLLAFLAILGTGMRQGLAAWRTRDREFSVLGLALAAALAGHMLHMAVDIFNSRTQVQMLWCILGLVAATYKLSYQEAFERLPALRQRMIRRPTRWATSAAQMDGGLH